MKLKDGQRKCGLAMMKYEHLLSDIKQKAEYLIKLNPGPVSKIIENSISNMYSIPQYESTLVLIDHMKKNSNIIVLASWLSLMLLEMLSKTDKANNIILLDHDKSVISVGQTISTMYKNMNIKYIRKNVVFDNISEYLINRDVIVIPSINMLLPFDDLLPKVPKDTLVSITGTSNMKMRYGNPIYNADDLKSQITYKELFFAKQYDTSWSINNSDVFKFITSVVVARI